MPELPEVEVVRLGLSPSVIHQSIAAVVIRQQRLRFPISPDLPMLLTGQKVKALSRRGKYLLFHLSHGTLLWHLGMSGSLRILTEHRLAQKHDHVDLCFKDGSLLRFNDPRRFGLLLYTEKAVERHPLISHLGPEPLEGAFTAEYLWHKSRKRKQALKTFMMDAKVVVGVGNIYANEALFAARLSPLMAAGELTADDCELLVKEIRKILKKAIKQGGTTLRNFVNSEGKPGYFKQTLKVYGRGGEACERCGKILKDIRLGQRTTVYCTNCQK